MNEELLKALQLIKEECKKHCVDTNSFMCRGCPMVSSDGKCGVMSLAPENWPLQKREVYF